MKDEMAGRWVHSGLVGFRERPELDFVPPVQLESVIGLRSFSDAAGTIDHLSGRWLAEGSRQGDTGV